MINQSTGCDFGRDGYIATRLCCNVHDEMTKNSRNSNSSSNMSITVYEKMLFVCLSVSFFFFYVSALKGRRQ
jgi:hypothetical protein